MNDVLIIANPSSGKKEAREYAEQAQAFLSEKGREAHIKYTDQKSDISDFAKRASDKRYKTIVVLGGDGTVAEMANGLKDESYKPSIGIIPTGTVNNVARSLTIPTKPEEAIKGLIRAKQRKMDVGLINNQLFLSTASAGAIPETVWEVSEEQKEKYGSAAYFFSGLQTLRENEYYKLKLEVDGQQTEMDLSLLLVGVSHSVSGFPHFFEEATYDDGKLYMFGLKNATLGEKMSLLPSILMKSEKFNDDQNIAFTSAFEKASLSIEDAAPYLAVDGEKGPQFPVDIKVLPRFLTFLVPGEENE